MLCWWQTEKLALRPMSGLVGGGGRLQFNSWTGLCVHRNCVSMCHSKGNGYYLVAGFIRNVLLYGNCQIDSCNSGDEFLCSVGRKSGKDLSHNNNRRVRKYHQQICDDEKLQTFYRLNKRINLVRVRTTLRESSLRVRTSRYVHVQLAEVLLQRRLRVLLLYCLNCPIRYLISLFETSKTSAESIKNVLCEVAF